MTRGARSPHRASGSPRRAAGASSRRRREKIRTPSPKPASFGNEGTQLAHDEIGLALQLFQTLLQSVAETREPKIALSFGPCRLRPTASRPVRRGRTPTMVRFQRPMSKGSPPGASILMTDGEWENFWAMLEARRGEIPTQRAPTTILPTRSPLHQTMNRLQQEGEWGAAESGLKMRPHKTHHRCGTCKGCTSSDCGLCKNCRDKPRYAAICVLLSAEAVASGRDGARLARSPGPNLRLGTLLDHIPRPRRVGASPACSPAPRARPAAPEAPEKCQARAHAPVPLHERPRRPPIARLVAPPLSTP